MKDEPRWLSSRNPEVVLRTQSGAGGQGVGAVRWRLAAARLAQIAGSVLVAEVQTEATLMLGAAGDKTTRRSAANSLLVNYSARRKTEIFFAPSVGEFWANAAANAVVGLAPAPRRAVYEVVVK